MALVGAQTDGLERAKVYFDHWHVKRLFRDQIARSETTELLVMAFGTLQIIASLALLAFLVTYDSIITICLRALIQIRGLVQALGSSSRCLSMFGPGRVSYFRGSFYTCPRLSFGS